MVTASQLRIWADTMRRWITRIDNVRTREQLGRGAAETKHLGVQKEPAERSLFSR